MKYIIVKVDSSGDSREWPIIFPDNLIHSIMADAMRRYFYKEAEAMGHPLPHVETVSAGAISIDVLYVGGKSESLKIESKDGDYNFISCLEYNHGMRGEDGT